ncbi:MAG: RHS repeat-associated core domain-containing protein [Nitrosomonas sp.]
MYDVHADHLNTPQVIVNSRNTTIWRWNNAHAFDANLPFKDPDNNDQTLEYNPRFPGQYFDKETNLHYNYFRHYESETGRYISPDPMGIAGGGITWILIIVGATLYTGSQSTSFQNAAASSAQ